MADTRTIEVWETQYDLEQLTMDKYLFQIAKSMVTKAGAPPVYNMVWQSQGLQPDAIIEWDVKYGLNWTKILPTVGAHVTIGGRWHSCNKGEILDIDQYGFFQTSSSTPVADFLAIGTNNFSPQGGGGINIVVGLQDNSGKWNPVFVDMTTMYTSGSGQWQPQESVKWWYETGLKQGSVISGVKTGAGGVDFTDPAPSTGNYYYSTTYNTKQSLWTNSESQPPSFLFAPVPDQSSLIVGDNDDDNSIMGPPPVIFWPVVAGITFYHAIKKTVQADFTAAIKVDFEKKYKYVTVKVKSDVEITATFKDPKGAELYSIEAMGTTEDEMKTYIEGVLTKDKKLLQDPSEGWTIEVKQSAAKLGQQGQNGRMQNGFSH